MNGKVYVIDDSKSFVEGMSRAQIMEYVSAGKALQVKVPAAAWSGSEAPYVADITGSFSANDAVNVYPIFSQDNYINEQLAYDKLSYTESYDGGVKIYAEAATKPATDLVIGLEVKLWQ